MKPRTVADGVYRVGTRWANFYLVSEDGAFTLIDAGYPRYWTRLLRAVQGLGSTPNAIRAVVVTHHHIDHVGTAKRLRSEAGSRVFVHEGDAPIVTGDRPSHVPPGFYRQSWRPSMANYLLHSAMTGGASYRPVPSVEALGEDQVLDVPGRPRIIYTPGHTRGHCSVLLPERGVLFSGDAMVNFDYATGRDGLRQHRFNEDRELALASLDRLDAHDAEIVLFGHGDPWTRGSGKALELVRERARPNG